MIKTFISHADTEDQFVDWLKVKLEADFPKLEIFVDHHASREGTLKVGDKASCFMKRIEESIFFISVCSTKYFESANCREELEHALNCGNMTNHGKPIIFPLIFKGEIPQEFRIRLSSKGQSTGILVEDFSDEKKWENSYENLRKSIQSKIDELRLLTEDADFYPNCEHLELILKRDKPTSAEVKMIMDVFNREEYQQYFFTRLDKLTWFSYLRNYGFFNRNPKPIESSDQPGSYRIPYWPVLSYLEKASLECSKSGHEKYAEDVIGVIRDVTKYRDENGEKINNFRTWWIFSKIMANLPLQVIKLEDVALIEEWLDLRSDTVLVAGEIGRRLLPKFLESSELKDWGKAALIVKIITKIKWATRQYGEDEPDTVIESYWLSELFKKNAPLLGAGCGTQTIDVLVERIKEILTKGKNDEYSYIWRPAIEDHTQNIGEYTTRNVLINALRDVLIAFSEGEHPEKNNILKKLLNSEHKILKRLAVFVIGKEWEGCKHLFLEPISEFIDETNFRHEVFMLIKENFKKFDERERKLIIACIEEGPKWVPEEEKERYVAEWKLGWLAAMYLQGDLEVDTLYEKYKDIVGLEPEHPEFASYTRSYAGTVAPIGIEELLDMSALEIVQYLNEFKGPERWPEQPSEEGLGDVLKEAVKREPHKFTSELTQFLKAKLLYKHRVISAFADLWGKKKTIDWEKVLSFCLKIVEEDTFWENEERYEDTEIRYRNWVTAAISDLIIGGTEDDSWAFDRGYLLLAERILLEIFRHQESGMEGVDNALSAAINTSRGRVIIALVNLALRVARLERKDGAKKKVRWNETTIRREFDARLDKSFDGSLEYSTLVGHYLPYLFYLDEEWVTKNINRIFPKDCPNHWNVAMQGYLSGDTFSNELYAILKENSHFERAFKTEFKDEHIRKRLLHQICVGYLGGAEGLEGDKSLFAKVLARWKQADICEIIWFFWSNRKVELGEDKRKRILDFWKYCYTKLKEKQLGRCEILSDLCLLTVFLESITDETRDWLILSAPHVDENYHSSFFIEYLHKLVEENPKEVGEVYLEVMKSSQPNYDERIIHSLVERLYQKGKKSLADQICDKYARVGQYFLRPLYEQYDR